MASPVEAASACDAFAITESDTTVVNFDALYVGTTGDVVVLTGKGSTTTFPTVPAGTILPSRPVSGVCQPWRGHSLVF